MIEYVFSGELVLFLLCLHYIDCDNYNLIFNFPNSQTNKQNIVKASTVIGKGSL
jgi:hypothetical protein